MKGLWIRTAILAAVGFMTGLLVGLGFLAITGIREYYTQVGLGRFALYMLLSGALGAVNMGATTIYSLEEWGLLRCTLTHFLIAMISVCVVGFTLGWLSLREPMTLWMLPACIIVYFIIWLVIYLRYKRRILRINAALRQWKDSHREE